ncbi:mycofactocin biosynthesis peptidyl-dipeptidase MftE [Mycolicibacterium komossense]|uniref:Mycofactocin biosynthesis peptidyl-dipeptidase MftE n=1 Tax=Mycolicibacterium komossense TaxID=1779 RepID=A0ABT3CDZ5_9MYCO|nr:mycofactocin biosynthesis peptidyl-dipeptidase MftE [Mycolicibacterium komossense]MCV7227461.1 mycofactocin biosynthesis peptidyl-dipeptidase MftE [Mycolicibacterium komossense]
MKSERNPSGASTIGARQVNWAYHRRVAFASDLGNSTSRQVQRQLQSTPQVAVIPVGSTEQHGPHLPLDTDTRIASAVARAVVTRLGECTSERQSSHPGYLLAPAIAYGASGEHEAFPGTISIGTEALEHLLLEFGRSAANWASRLVFVNGHGGNVGALAAAVRRLRFEGRDASWCSCSVQGGDAHAGHTETSVLLYISPSDVRIEDSRPGNSAPLVELLPSMRRGGVAAVSEVGVLGDPTTATATDGARLFDEMVQGCSDRIGRWQPRSDGLLI